MKRVNFILLILMMSLFSFVVSASNATFDNLNITNVLNLNPITVPVGNANSGDVFYNSSLTSPMFYNGSAWRVFGYGAPIGTIGDYNSTCPSGWTAFGDNTKQTDLGGRWVLIQNKTASNVASVNFTTGITSSYIRYNIFVDSLVSASNSVTMIGRISQDGGATWKSGASNYKWNQWRFQSLAGTGAGGSNGDTSISLSNINFIASQNSSISSSIEFSNPSALNYKHFSYTTQMFDTILNHETDIGGGSYVADNSSINGFTILMSSGNIISGNFYLYGLVTQPTLAWCQKTSDDTPITAGLWSLINGFITQTDNTNKINLSGVYTKNGSIGIGISSPAYQLEINSYSSLASLNVSNILYVNPAPAGVGINTPNPITPLDVNGLIRTRATSKGTCNSGFAGSISYEVVNNTGNFYGCRQTGNLTYSWAILN